MKFLIGRLIQMVLVVLSVTFLAFAALNFLGDPLFNILGPIADEASGPEFAEVREQAREEFHLDEPFIIRYGLWLGDISQGDFGRSFANGTTVNEEISSRLPLTIQLMIYAQFLAVLISVPWALWSASKAFRAVDKISTVVSFGMLGIPVFALAVVVFWLFAVRWNIFPTRYDGSTIPSRLFSMFLPASVLAVPLIATYQRLLRTDLISTLQEDFIAVARAKGLPQWRILVRHALRPSLFSLLTVFGIQTGALIGGSLIVESFFNIPGVGAAVVEAIIRDDFPVVLAIVVVVSVIFVVVNFFVDITYSFLDPRVQLND